MRTEAFSLLTSAHPEERTALVLALPAGERVHLALVAPHLLFAFHLHEVGEAPDVVARGLGVVVEAGDLHRRRAHAVAVHGGGEVGADLHESLATLQVDGAEGVGVDARLAAEGAYDVAWPLAVEAAHPERRRVVHSRRGRVVETASRSGAHTYGRAMCGFGQTV